MFHSGTGDEIPRHSRPVFTQANAQFRCLSPNGTPYPNHSRGFQSCRQKHKSTRIALTPRNPPAQRSPEGKAASSLNALKTGIDAWSQIIPGEDPAELEALTEAFQLHFHPADPNQLALVDTLISTEWLARRLRRIEAQLWHYQVECLDKNLTHAEFIDAAIQHNSPLGHAYQDALDPFSRLQRRVDSNNRMYLRTLKALQDLQARGLPRPFPNRLPPCQFNHLRRKLGSFRNVRRRTQKQSMSGRI